MGVFDRFKNKTTLEDLKKLSPKDGLMEIDKIDNQKMLVEIAKDNTFFLYQTKAFKKIKDKNIQLDLIRNEKDSSTRYMFIENINDEDMLLDILQFEKDNRNRGLIAEKIHDETTLINIAKNDESSEARQNAIKNPNFKNQELIIDMAKNDEDHNVRKEAMKKVKDDDILDDIGRNDSDKYIKMASIKSMSGEKLDEFIKENQNNPDVIKSALENPHCSEDILMKFVNETELYHILVIKNPNFKNQSVLKDVAKNDENWELRMAAVKKINDEKFLEEIIMSEKEWNIRNVIVNKITDKKILKNISENNSMEIIRETAKKRL